MRAETTTRLQREQPTRLDLFCAGHALTPPGADPRTYSEQRRRFFPPPEARRCSFFVHARRTPRTRAHPLRRSADARVVHKFPAASRERALDKGEQARLCSALSR